MAQYRTGTASVTNGSATVTGTDTAWLDNVKVGDAFLVPAIPVVYTVAAVTSDTALQLSSPYAGTDRTDDDYVIVRDFTTGGIPELNRGDIETAAIFTRAMRQIESLISIGAGVPGSGAQIYPDTASGLAGTSDADYFWVPEGGLNLYQHDSGSAIFINSFPTSADLANAVAAMNAMESRVLNLIASLHPDFADTSLYLDFRAQSYVGRA